MNPQTGMSPADQARYDDDLQSLEAAKHDWARTPVEQRIALLQAIKDALIPVAQDWATTAAGKKQIPEGSPLVGEEWVSGPMALMSACNGLIGTLAGMNNKAYLHHLPTRQLPSGQTAVKVTPHTIWDHLLMSGVKAEVWMQPGVTKANLSDHAASLYNDDLAQASGNVALVLGAGNIAAIAPLDAFQKLFLENRVVLLKMNPVNDYLTPFLQAALTPLIDIDALRIVKGAGEAGAYLCEHDLVEEIHVTGAGATHDAIVWGMGSEATTNKAAGTPKNPRKMTSELGAVCPTIVVPGPWTKSDLKFQAEQIATHKLHNSGFNCVACQTLILPQGWDKTEQLMTLVAKEMARCERGAYYPGADTRVAEFAKNAGKTWQIYRGAAPAVEVACFADEIADWLGQNEVFGPAISTKTLPAKDPESYLQAAVDFANEALFGTLGANILIHPKTIRQIGKRRVEEIISELRYGTIAINAWTGIAFLVTSCPWGGYPNATLDNVGSGIGTVHNTFMLENVERTVISAPWRPFPRGLLSGQFTLLPRPPWFISNRRQHIVGRLLTEFQYKPSWSKLPRIFLHALRG